MHDINYSTYFSPFKNRLVLQQLGLAIGLPFGVLLVIMIILKAWYGFLLVVVFLSLSTLFVSLLYGRYHMRFSLNEKGIQAEPESDQVKRNGFMNTLTVAAGMLSKNLSVSGAGYLAHSNQKQFFSWNQIKSITKAHNYYQIVNKQHQRMVLTYPKQLEIEIKQYISYKTSELSIELIDKTVK